MSDAQNQGEPTMEEILASIRKIISEDGTPQDGEAPEEGAEAEAAPDAAPEEPVAAEPEAPPPPPAEAAEEAAAAVPEEPAPAADDGAEEDDDVLDLTKMVGEDGDVVDLADAAEKEVAAEPPAPEPAEDLDDFDAEADDEVPDLVAIESEEPAEPEPEAPADVDSLLADTTQAAVTSSLTAVATAVGPQEPASGLLSGDSKTLEMLVREVMEPYLKTWLDENLAGMVERIVRDEVQKMARRAEYR